MEALRFSDVVKFLETQFPMTDRPVLVDIGIIKNGCKTSTIQSTDLHKLRGFITMAMNEEVTEPYGVIWHSAVQSVTFNINNDPYHLEIDTIVE